MDQTVWKVQETFEHKVEESIVHERGFAEESILRMADRLEKGVTIVVQGPQPFGKGVEKYPWEMFLAAVAQKKYSSDYYNWSSMEERFLQARHPQ